MYTTSLQFIRLVTFDALHTLITPRKPVYVQYSEVFAPFLGVLSPSAIRRSFKTSLSQVQKDKPAYQGQFGARGWWSEVIKRTAIGAGADPQAVQASLDEMVPRLMDRFSSSEGYKLFDDALPIRMLFKNAYDFAYIVVDPVDATTTGLVLADLGLSPFLRPVILSEEEGIEKPNAEIFRRAFKQALGNSSHFDQAVHVGDELQCDYYGAQAAGMQAVLIRRAGPDGIQEHKEADEDLSSVRVISSLHDVVDWVGPRVAS